jgi:hypothetical protein
MNRNFLQADREYKNLLKKARWSKMQGESLRLLSHQFPRNYPGLNTNLVANRHMENARKESQQYINAYNRRERERVRLIGIIRQFVNVPANATNLGPYVAKAKRAMNLGHTYMMWWRAKSLGKRLRRG